jgi:hypothetical protein
VNALEAAGWLMRSRPSIDESRRGKTTRYALTAPDDLVRGVAPDLVRGVASGSAGRRIRSSERDDNSLVRGVAPNHVKDLRARHARARRLPWCGDCNEETRQLEDDAGDPVLCPRCNWRTAGTQ